MRFGVLLLIALALGALVAHWLLGDQGYVLVDIRGWTLETSVPGLVLALLAAYALVRLISWTIRAPRRMGRAVGDYRARRGQRHLDHAFAAIAEGQWGRGERLLGRAAHGPASLAGYLAAARAAQEQGATERRDEWLRLAYEADPGAAPAVLLTQADLQLEQGQLEEALATLQQLDSTAPAHPRGLALRARVLERLDDWDGLERLLPQLRAAKALDKDAAQALEVRVSQARLAAAQDGTELDRTWQGLERSMRRDPAVLETYTEAALRVGAADQAEPVLRRALKSTWSVPLVAAYGRLETSDPSSQLAAAEKWLDQHPEDAELLLTCGRLSLRNQLWGKARSYLETSLAIRPHPDTWQIYGELLVQLGESGAASEAFRQGLAAASGRTPALPAPRSGAA
ncbi:heme biosynthesis HemY N-terminal domain-containing protein [Wenzhouxiangella sp. XN24]|uniref:heme biosynthesis protein HemY n=1 Tax=Wenzhouxiangella sp. XN24 TaxID=2713569 RepID=UPI0013EBE6B3|nr:heme biosynthesis HemY N-terminal domain-containing protein [Wenzhouxiangella sp. XN24]NGX17357.1 tetratricopeptide repeat protein [Wenzhouxiangella sp. XN24]